MGGDRRTSGRYTITREGVGHGGWRVHVHYTDQTADYGVFGTLKAAQGFAQRHAYKTAALWAFMPEEP